MLFRLDCMSQSYPDLSKTQKKQIVNWATKNDKKLINLADLGQFMLDLPLSRIKKLLKGDAVSCFN